MILNGLVSFLAVASFIVAFAKLGVISAARKATAKVYSGLSAMLDSELDDYAKEVEVRRSGLGLIVSAFDIFWRFLVIFAISALPVLIAEVVLPVTSAEVFGLMLTWQYIVIVTAAVLFLSLIVRRFRFANDAKPIAINRYSSGDRMLHMLAFSSPSVLRLASASEDKILLRGGEQPTGKPIFITSLARGGTTALLNAFSEIPEIATHTYQDMPFVTSPVLWELLGRRSKKNATRHQRAHGDGLEIDLNSPEAFEEVIWKMFWPEKFSGEKIKTWDVGDHNAAAEKFLNQHMKKIVRARRLSNLGSTQPPTRYCSKNNSNIARLPYLVETFPDCKIIVPVRRPESHAASLLRQHCNFLNLQEADSFVCRYMRDIGHYEFGLLHKPIAFPGFEPDKYSPNTPDYWMFYWICAFEHVLQHRNLCTLVFQDELRENPDYVMGSLCDSLNLTRIPGGFSSYFRKGADISPKDVYQTQLYNRADDVYKMLISI